ncbi:histidine kinase [Pseudomonas sp. Leaf48]|uniref:transporter substrate-binding domain-containing protein n=1 Tax=Pseudomonas sp. Leaf48 TaxID=1736221 RepID=UPI000725CD31|nr:transporter substrate-binding domain-containing protein [Pseudomonas sp. Leaf48]KQN56005.1 histidine kinase [Pseudomonas sp. Leaf48]
MLVSRGFKSAARWLLLMAVLGAGQWAVAAQSGKPRASDTGTLIKLDARERQWLAEHPRVVVASKQYPRYLFRDAEGRWSGFNYDVLQRISAMTGLQFVYDESFSTGQLLARLENGAADMSTILSMNDERKALLDFSHAFGGAAWVFVGRAQAPVVESLEQLKKRVLVLPSQHALEPIIRRDFPSIEVRTVKTYAEARAWVESGEAYATIENEITARLYPPGQLQVGHAVEGTWAGDYLAVRKGQPQLLSILNKALEAFPPAELRAIRHKWFETLAPAPRPSTWQRLNRESGWGLLLVSVLAVLLLLWSRRRAVLARQRPSAEKKLRDKLAFQNALIDAMPDPMFVRDLQGRLVMCNKSYEDVLSTRFDLIQGRQLTEVDVMPRHTAELLHSELMAQLAARRARFCERQLMFKDGMRNIYQWSVPFYSADGQLRGLLGGWADIGQRSRQS